MRTPRPWDIPQLTKLDNMLDTGVYHPPEPLDNLPMGIEWCWEVYRYYRTSLPDDRRALILQYLKDANVLLDMARNAG